MLLFNNEILEYACMCLLSDVLINDANFNFVVNLVKTLEND